MALARLVKLSVTTSQSRSDLKSSFWCGPYSVGRATKAVRRPAAAERMPLADASVDIATSTFLYHELPPDVRRQVTGEIARVLKPGGQFVFLDSLQMGDRPGWDGLLEAFPTRFHEPYYRGYAIDDLEAMFSDAGLAPRSMSTPYLAKLMAREKR